MADEPTPPVEPAADSAPTPPEPDTAPTGRARRSIRKAANKANHARGRASARTPASASTDARPRGSERRTSKAALARNLERQLSSVADLLDPINPGDAAIIRDGAAKLASAWSDVAEVNPTVRRWLEGGSIGGVYFAAFSATFSVAFPIAMNHGLIPMHLIARAFAFPGRASSNGATADGATEPESATAR